MNIVFLGSGAFGIPSLQALAASHHKILHVITQPDRPAGRGKQLTPTPVGQLAATNGWPLTKTDNVNAPEMLALLAALKPDAFVVIAFGQKLSDPLLAIAPHGGINLHSSLLPKYRGAAPINWAVINNEPLAGVSVIEVTNIMDGGQILATASTPIGPAETAGELHDRLANLGAPLLPEVLTQIAEGHAIRTPQDQTQISKAPKLSREMAWIDFSLAAPLVSARIRGLAPWPGVQVQFTPAPASGKAPITLTLLKCRATDATTSHPPERQGTVLADKSIACGTGSIELITVQPAGKKPMDLAAFANGYGYGPGATLKSTMAVTPVQR
jgi:methionyl-tRNA formyltransferase